MFAFAVAVGFQDGVPNAERVHVMGMGFPAYSPDGVSTQQAPHAAAVIARWEVVRRDHLVTPRWDPARQLLFAGDIRLHNRPELGRLLDLTGSAVENLSDLDLAWLAYATWGPEAVHRLVGDFAFAVWDDRRRSLFAARDPLGVRPLYYSELTDGAVLASDVRQLLPLNRRPYDDVNPEALLGRFVHSRKRPGSTFFRSISLLQPGHSLVIEQGRKSEVRYWNPTPKPLIASYQDNCAELLRLFRRAVRDRLDSDHPIVAHSSGGFDSSTILMACDQVYRQESGRPPLITASALTPGFPCDDSRYMDAIAAQVAFERVTWSAVHATHSPVSVPEMSFVQPIFRRGPGGGPGRDLELAKERGARVLLGGMYGDEVLFGGGIHFDMFRGGRWSELLRETLINRDPRGRGGRMLVESVLGVLPPGVAAALLGQLSRRHHEIPAWFGPVLRKLSLSTPEYKGHPDASWPSHVAYNLWARVTGTQAPSVLDNVILYGSEAGIEVRLPFSDVRIVEHLLTIPWDQRFPRGHLRRTGRDALGPLLPVEFSSRRNQAAWTPVFVKNTARIGDYISGILNGEMWHSAPFIDQAAARAVLGQSTQDVNGALAKSWPVLLDLVGIECWLRGLFCYNPPAR